MKNIVFALLKYLLFLFWIFPISKKRILCWCFIGKGYGDSPKYVAEELLKRYGENIDIGWVVDSKNIKPMHGIMPIKKYSLKYFYYIATSRIWVFNTRAPIYFTKRKKQFYIQTWHGGIGLKRVEAEALDLSTDYIKTAKRDSAMIDLMISNSKYRTEQYKNNFWYNGEIAEVGLPRNDSFFSPVNRKKICKELEIAASKKIVLYVPTFRSYEYDYFQVDFEELIKRLEERDGKEYVVLIRLHPNVTKKIEVNENAKIINAGSYPDADELIALSDYLISDYSSIMFDAVYSKTPVYLFAPDFKKYSKGRGFTWDYMKLPYAISENSDQLLKQVVSNEHLKKEKNLKEFIKEQRLCDDGNASKRVCDIIEKEMKRSKK